MFEAIKREIRKQSECVHRWFCYEPIVAERREVVRLNEWNPYTGRLGTLRKRTRGIVFEQGRVKALCRKCGAYKTFHPFSKPRDVLSLASVSVRAY